MNLLPRPVEAKAAVIEMHRAPGREVVRQLPPRAARAIEVEDCINHLTQIDGARAAALFGRRNQRFDQSPLTVRYVRRIWIPFHPLAIGSSGRLFTHVLSDVIVHIKVPSNRGIWRVEPRRLVAVRN